MRILNPIYKIFLMIVCIFPFAEALEVGDHVPDFVMPSSNGAPQRLSEQIGKPVMLVWLDACDQCEETLIDLQYLAESLAVEGLQTWFLWRKQTDYTAPWSRLPVLEYQASNSEAWWFKSAPAVMFVSPDGVLDYLVTDSVNDRKLEVSNELKLWLNNKEWFQ
ncbi:MAG: redoxin domain-containing protein [Oleispira antarctica]|nr:redoxin domain-containing protein [Oleispira antarctica]MBQ0791467.1 redoxin domain-containing protein [Oleispira antarctica]